MQRRFLKLFGWFAPKNRETEPCSRRAERNCHSASSKPNRGFKLPLYVGGAPLNKPAQQRAPIPSILRLYIHTHKRVPTGERGIIWYLRPHQREMAPLVPVLQLGGRGERVKCVPPTSSSGQIQLILGPMFSGELVTPSPVSFVIVWCTNFPPIQFPFVWYHLFQFNCLNLKHWRKVHRTDTKAEKISGISWGQIVNKLLYYWSFRSPSMLFWLWSMLKTSATTSPALLHIVARSENHK